MSEEKLVETIKRLVEQLKEHEGEEYWTAGDEEAVERGEAVMRLVARDNAEKCR